MENQEAMKAHLERLGLSGDLRTEWRGEELWCFSEDGWERIPTVSLDTSKISIGYEPLDLDLVEIPEGARVGTHAIYIPVPMRFGV